MTRANYWLGRSNDPTGIGYFQGAISSMQIWSRALGADEVAALYALDGVCLATPTPAPTPRPTPAPTASALERALEHSLCFDQCDFADQVGSMDATAANGAACARGVGVALNGVDEYVTFDDGVLQCGVGCGVPDVTVALWFRANSSQSVATYRLSLIHI